MAVETWNPFHPGRLKFLGSFLHSVDLLWSTKGPRFVPHSHIEETVPFQGSIQPPLKRKNGLEAAKGNS